MYTVFALNFFHRDDPNFYGRLLARFTVHRVAMFGSVLSVDLLVRSLAMK